MGDVYERKINKIYYLIKKTMKKYVQAPLPFVGQKRMFVAQFVKVLPQFSDKKIFIDLFGGSGFLSHTTKRERPDAKVIYNDYDNYMQRIANIPRTNKFIADLREIAKECDTEMRIDDNTRNAIIERIEKEDVAGYVDYITLSASLLYSSKSAANLEELKKISFYNRIRKSDYTAEDYLEGVEIVSCDYRQLFERYKDNPDVVFIVDPPYLSTVVETYTMSWKLGDYLDVLAILKDSSYIYFTSNKSNIIELCEWIGENYVGGNPFRNASKIEIKAHINRDSKYTDIMLYKQSS